MVISTDVGVIWHGCPVKLSSSLIARHRDQGIPKEIDGRKEFSFIINCLTWRHWVVVHNLCHIKMQLIVHHLQTNGQIRIDQVLLIPELHIVFSSLCIDLLIRYLWGHFMIVDQDFLELLDLTWKCVTIQCVFFHPWKGLVDHCLQHTWSNGIICYMLIINRITRFLFGRSLVWFHSFLIVCLDANNRSLTCVISPSL